MIQTAHKLYSELYDLYVSNWENEIEFYTQHSIKIQPNGEVLEVACGTGRITIQLAKSGIPITGLDYSGEMLAIAQSKGEGIKNIQWIQADMRTFRLDKKFELAIIPAHSFQFMETANDQAQCLTTIKHHLTKNAQLIIHLDNPELDWLGEIGENPFDITEYGKKLIHPTTQRTCRRVYTWGYERSTQTAIYRSSWQILDAEDNVIESYESEPMRLHCAFSTEMEHLIYRSGFEIEALYGDFSRNEFHDESESMIWVLRNIRE